MKNEKGGREGKQAGGSGILANFSQCYTIFGINPSFLKKHLRITLPNEQLNPIYGIYFASNISRPKKLKFRSQRLS